MQRAGWKLGSLMFGIFVGLALRTRGEDAANRPSFERDVLPLLRVRCLKCHGPIKPKGELNLSGPRSLARGGSNGPVVVPGNLEESMLWDLVSRDKMPPKPEERLSSNEKGLLRRWIELGAEKIADAATIAQATPEADHWAFAAAARPIPPVVQGKERARTSIDRFIQKVLENQGLAMGPDADQATLIRRLCFDVTGIPPEPDDVRAFVGCRDPAAYEKLVERLLASPQYGERWGKFWLDAAGYADSNGYFSADSDRPLAYRYRDYVISAFNADRPLDEVVREQLAGDELAGDRRQRDGTPAVVSQLIATHFLRNSQDGTGESDGNPDEVLADKYAVVEGTVQVIGSSLLGLTLQCAKCHNHKYEPVTQREYYQLQAILYPAFNFEHWLKPNDRIVISGPREQLARWEAREKAVDAEINALKRRVPSGPESAKVEKAVQAAIQAANAKREPNPGRIAWVSDVSAEPAEVPLLVRGNPATPGPKVGPDVPSFLSDPDNRYAPAPPFAGAKSTGRRLAFARWLTKPGSRPAALLARVLANRIWQHHFGIGLVATSDNLGYTGSPPSHPELIEFLASELMRLGWNAKSLHRLILLSTVYRQSSASRPETARVDPDNSLLARFSLRRLDAEAIRDAMLTVSGDLDQRAGGPYVPTHRTDSGEVIVDESIAGAKRRSVYLQQRRTQIDSLLEVFDAPSIVTTCTRQLASTIPLQSLSLLNSNFVMERAKRLAARLDLPAKGDPPCDATGQSDTDAFVTRAFLCVYGREPNPVERDASRQFLRTQPSLYPSLTESNARDRARANFCQMLLASNGFLYVE
jgi:Protein of unknown function (DUF1553)/Protein of unknown function (DUF1549)/Planctomycete cytochrome C